MYGYEDKISTADRLAVQVFGTGKTRREFIVAVLGKKNLSHKAMKAIGGNTGDAVYAYVNWSRWIARCPHCGGREAVNPHKKNEGFFCLSCANYMNGGLPRPIIYPANYKDIEKELEKRPDPHKRNWRTGQTIENLKLETMLHRTV
jgi:hypothetical protein